MRKKKELLSRDHVHHFIFYFFILTRFFNFTSVLIVHLPKYYCGQAKARLFRVLAQVFISISIKIMVVLLLMLQNTRLTCFQVRKKIFSTKYCCVFFLLLLCLALKTFILFLSEIFCVFALDFKPKKSFTVHNFSYFGVCVCFFSG